MAWSIPINFEKMLNGTPVKGEEYGAVTAHDFVTGIKHAVESKSEGLFLIQNSIKGLDAYAKGETTDFKTVGVKALDDYTVQYTLERPESFLEF